MNNYVANLGKLEELLLNIFRDSSSQTKWIQQTLETRHTVPERASNVLV